MNEITRTAFYTGYLSKTAEFNINPILKAVTGGVTNAVGVPFRWTKGVKNRVRDSVVSLGQDILAPTSNKAQKYMKMVGAGVAGSYAMPFLANAMQSRGINAKLEAMKKQIQQQRARQGQTGFAAYYNAKPMRKYLKGAKSGMSDANISS